MILKKLLKLSTIISFVFLSSIVCVNGAENIPKINIHGKAVNFSRKPMNLNGRILVPAEEFIERIGGKVKTFDDKGISFEKSGKQVAMNWNEPWVLVDGVYQESDSMPVLKNGLGMVPIRSLSTLYGLKVGWNAEAATISVKEESAILSEQFKIVIDPGHGGYEKGAQYGGVYEKNINLDISKKVAALLKEEGFDVYMTRKKDVYVGLYERTEYANRLGADLFVSVHNNAGYSSDRGTMTLFHPNYVENPNFSTYSVASKVQNELVKTLGSENLGLIPRPNLAVLRTSNMPAILVEVGYMTNKNELNKLLSSNYKQKAAMSITNGIIKAIRKEG